MSDLFLVHGAQEDNQEKEGGGSEIPCQWKSIEEDSARGHEEKAHNLALSELKKLIPISVLLTGRSFSPFVSPPLLSLLVFRRLHEPPPSNTHADDDVRGLYGH